MGIPHPIIFSSNVFPSNGFLIKLFPYQDVFSSNYVLIKRFSHQTISLLSGFLIKRIPQQTIFSTNGFIIKRLHQEERFLFNLSKNMKQENVHIKFSKFSLGVGKRTTNIAVLGELGRYPLLLEVILNIFRYFKYLLKSEDVLLSEALKVSKSLKSLNIDSWYGSIESLMQYINIDVEKVKNMKIDLKSLIYSKLKQKYNFVWRSEIYDDRNNKQGGNKLRTYRLSKDNISLEFF